MYLKPLRCFFKDDPLFRSAFMVCDGVFAHSKLGRPIGLRGLGYTRESDYPIGQNYLAGRDILAGLDILARRITWAD